MVISSRAECLLFKLDIPVRFSFILSGMNCRIYNGYLSESLLSAACLIMVALKHYIVFLKRLFALIDLVWEHDRMDLVETLGALLFGHLNEIFIEEHRFLAMVQLPGGYPAERAILFLESTEFCLDVLIQEVGWTLLIITQLKVVCWALTRTAAELEHFDFSSYGWAGWGGKGALRFMTAAAIGLWHSLLRPRKRTSFILDIARG